MKFLFDLFPVILFCVAYKFAGIYVATGVAIAAPVIKAVEPSRNLFGVLLPPLIAIVVISPFIKRVRPRTRR